MKRLLALLLALALLFPISVGSIQSPTGFAGKLWASTFALYGTRGPVTHFICTTEPIEKIAGGYRLLSAGHCVQSTPADLQFSVAEEIGGARTPVKMVKAYLGEDVDFALFELKTDKVYPVFELGTEKDLKVGDAIINPNFSQGLGKQLSMGVVASMPITKSEDCEDAGCVGKFIIHESAGPGASGSAVLSVKTHKVVGVLVWEFEGKVGFGVEPISVFVKFMAGPNQPHPGVAPVSAVIPDNVFAAQFGEEHPFTLTVHGPSPVFVQGGYKFRAETDGFELSDDYYYNVPVFIAQDENGYRLTSTKDGVAVDVTALEKE